ncbi:unnamed protein product [Linum trigynum]|uniref:Uncharacterized protein n=1 Tax=Linum trigynum TaxID=586398 RepID=A0AAV2DA49_9ROSI
MTLFNTLGALISLMVETQYLSPRRQRRHGGHGGSSSPAAGVQSPVRSIPEVDLGDHLEEGRVDVEVVPGGGLDEGEVLRLRQAPGFLLAYLSQLPADVAFVADEDDDHVGAAEAAELVQPLFHVVECRSP